MADFDPSLKKKKTKKVTIAGDVADEAKPDAPEAMAAAADPADLAGVDATELFGKKKKKKQPTKKAGEDEADGAAAGEQAAVVSDLIDYPDWPDYSYDELLTRVFTIMHEKNPSLSTGESKRIQMKPPNVTRAGTKKTAFINFAEICRLLKRQPKHVMQFLMAELGTSGSVDGSNQLIIKGRFQQKHFETVLRKYIKSMWRVTRVNRRRHKCKRTVAYFSYSARRAAVVVPSRPSRPASRQSPPNVPPFEQQQDSNRQCATITHICDLVTIA